MALAGMAEPPAKRSMLSMRLRINSCVFLGCAISIALAGCNRADETRSASFEVIGRFPHDPTAYTQGLVWDDSVLYESTGLYGHSELRQADLQTGNVRRSVPLPGERFGEGLALLDGKLYQLTWQSGIAYVYDKQTLALLDSVSYAGEGWGLATNGHLLIMSDGSDSLRVVTPATFKSERVVHVRYQGSPLYKLNELEYVNGNVLANVYESDWVVRIDPASGEVLELMDFADLYPDRPATAQVMNGIAVAPDGHGLLLTGKDWPALFHVRLKDPAQP